MMIVMIVMMIIVVMMMMMVMMITMVMMMMIMMMMVMMVMIAMMMIMMLIMLFNQIVHNTGVTKTIIHTDQRERYESKNINGKNKCHGKDWKTSWLNPLKIVD
jgi:hypothetical protein